MSDGVYCTCEHSNERNTLEYRWCDVCNKPFQPRNFRHTTEVEFVISLLDSIGLVRLRRICDLIGRDWHKIQSSGKPFYEEFYDDTRISLSGVRYIQDLIEVEERRKKEGSNVELNVDERPSVEKQVEGSRETEQSIEGAVKDSSELYEQEK